jgi:hypothetical protein
VALLGIGVIAAACGGASPSSGVAGLGTTTTATSAAQGGSTASPSDTALAFIGCMRTHGEPNMPEPSISQSGGHTNVNVSVGSGVDPNSPQFTRTYSVCKHLLPNNGVAKATTITPADQADYLKGVACMRSHGISNFPDPTFKDNTVTFTPTTPIDTSSSEYKSALATCQKLIPAGLPYSSSSNS